MPLIFSYGSLQEEAVQLAVYGRALRANRDALVGWVRTLIEVPQWHKAAAQGTTHYANLERSQSSSDIIEGTVLEVSDAELAASDGYEDDAGYQRAMITLTSGRRAWVYVSAQSSLED